MSDLALFASAVASILLSPGPTNTLLSASGALVGLTRSAHLTLIELAGYGISIAIWLCCARPIVDGMPQIGLAVRLGLICYLLVLSRHLWRTHITPTARTAVISGARVFFTTLLNPKAFILPLPPFRSYMACRKQSYTAALLRRQPCPFRSAGFCLALRSATI
jgi:threonine/homoserine/homoserine lactone efflux protein